MSFKYKIFIFAGIIIALIAAGVIYGLYRQKELSGLELGGVETVPQTNPFEAEINPFEFYKNPFDSAQGEPFDAPDSSFLGNKLLLAHIHSLAGVNFPVAELGGCSGRQECQAFCNNIENISVCVDFAEEHNLMSAQDAVQARKFAKAGGVGPGECTSKDECETYCRTIDHIEECVAFAEKYGVLPDKELKEAQAIASYIRAGGKMPGGCNSKAECEAYCEEAAHMKECLDFAEVLGLIPPAELAEARKVMPFMMRGETPGGCTSKQECDVYCKSVEHMEECLNFAEQAGLIGAEELKMARKVLPFMLRGETPGGCLSKEECEAYCSQPPHFLECLDFAGKAGIMNPIEVKMLKRLIKMAPKGTFEQ